MKVYTVERHGVIAEAVNSKELGNILKALEEEAPDVVR